MGGVQRGDLGKQHRKCVLGSKREERGSRRAKTNGSERQGWNGHVDVVRSSLGRLRVSRSNINPARYKRYVEVNSMAFSDDENLTQ
ncbi:hypothetical protein PsorP6_002257 [Peronosclerospora sorghi]|uniref:Uncharacterized protein n=1 Tax=Peronosclerospora sorghi TaxID=230839 RepID=A0ACC0WYV2_9STRA|nr:hypothetical protein PsorP6_002257 [Peronosclerospora sorghi]